MDAFQTPMPAFRIGDWFVQPAFVPRIERPLTIHLRPKVWTCWCLAAHGGEVVTKETLLETVWRTRFVTESALTRAVTELRQALDDQVAAPWLLETIPKRGYRLIPAVVPVEGEARAPAARPVRRGEVVRRWRLAMVLAGLAGVAVAVVPPLTGMRR